MATKTDNTEQSTRRSRIAEWLDANRGGIAVVTDWRAVNR